MDSVIVLRMAVVDGDGLGLWYNLPLINYSILCELYLCMMEWFNRGKYALTCMMIDGVCK